jgi:hypothetical protein
MEDVPSVADFEAAVYWRCVDDGDADAASALTAQLEGIVERWRLAGVAEDRLAQLPHDSWSGVRYAASAGMCGMPRVA